MPRAARLPRHVPPSNARYDLIHALRALTISSATHRDYATETITPKRPGRPKKAVGEPSRPVKRAVKKAAKSPKEDTATKKVKARKETAAKKAKKPAKTQPRKVKPDEELTPQQLAKRQQYQRSKANAGVRALKKAALKPPPSGGVSAWTMLVAENVAGTMREEGNNGGATAALTRVVGSAKEKYNNLTPAEREVS